jgi:Kef-type K+ transport system membrane component KefB
MSLPAFLIQLVIIIITCRVFGYVFKRMGQPTVMGEILAGIFLGPSLLGALFPGYLNYVFPAASLGPMRILSQVGLILFMFVVGMELDLTLLKQKAKAAAAISITSIVFPYALGVGLAYFLYQQFAPANVPFHAFALFMGIAMSITAFPVLARIIREKGLTNTHNGSVAITAAAVDDVSGWCILALVIAIAKANALSDSLYTLGGTILYVLGMFYVVKPLLYRFSKAKISSPIIRQSTMAIILIMMLLSALCTELIGIHALFGAFLAGVIMPHEWDLRKSVTDKVEDVALIMLLPLFFVITGLRTEIGALNSLYLWGVCGLVILLAIAGKFGGSALAAKMTGESNHSSLTIGILMNTRGLMELVILNIGFELGILKGGIFTIMVIMAVVTTFMTSPLLNLVDRYYQRKGKM